MQKTFAIYGKRFTAKQITKLFDKENMSIGLDYIVFLNGTRFVANYRHDDGDNYFAPVCNKQNANCIKLECTDFYMKPVWLSL